MGTRLVFVCALLFFSTHAHSSEISPKYGESNAAYIVGRIEVGDVEKVSRFLHRQDTAKVYLESPGGVLIEALKIGRVLREHEVHTIVESGASCTSACPFVLAGGLFRTVERGANIGVHMASAMNSEVAIGSAIEDILDLGVQGVRTVIARSEYHASRLAVRSSIFLLEMGVSPRLMHPATKTLPNEMYFLSWSEIRDFNLDNSTE